MTIRNTIVYTTSATDSDGRAIRREDMRQHDSRRRLTYAGARRIVRRAVGDNTAEVVRVECASVQR